jgi:hypothetical protein
MPRRAITGYRQRARPARVEVYPTRFARARQGFIDNIGRVASTVASLASVLSREARGRSAAVPITGVAFRFAGIASMWISGTWGKMVE